MTTTTREHDQVTALIGDVVDSKRAASRSGLQEQVVAALTAVNQAVQAIQPLSVTLGDEFQGVYRTVGLALRASLLIRLHLLPVDTRYGIGTGEVTVFEADRPLISQDGSAWWAAREAIDHVHDQQGLRGHARSSRTWLVDGGDRGDALNAFLLTRDETVGQQSDRARRLLLGWLLGRTQRQLAEAEAISQSAVSQQLANSGAYAIRDAHDTLDRAHSREGTT